MEPTPRQLAERHSFQALINGYLREVDAGVAWPRVRCLQEVADAEGYFRAGGICLKIAGCDWLLSLAHASRVGRQRIDAIFSKGAEGYQAEEWWPAKLQLIKALFAPDTGRGAARRQWELTQRIFESVANMERYVTAAVDAPPVTFIEAEQRQPLGHWLHPAPKSRQGMLAWQHDFAAPELGGRFQLHYFAAQPCLVRDYSVGSASCAQLLREEFDRLGVSFDLRQGEALLAVHPLQANWLAHREHFERWCDRGWLRPLGPQGPHYTATSSLRTVYHPRGRWMLKGSVPVKITNSLRQNRLHELAAGVAMAELLPRLPLAQALPSLTLLNDPAAITLNETPDAGESGFELILRENACAEGLCLAAWTQDPANPAAPSYLHQHLAMLAQRERRPVTQVARQWFSGYLTSAITPLIQLYDRFGIALEAHQQNSLITFRDGYPAHYTFRDNQGFYLAAARRASLTALAPRLGTLKELFYEPPEIAQRFGYYLLLNNLFSVIDRLAADQLLAEDLALALTRDTLAALRADSGELGQALLTEWLDGPGLANKASLLTRAKDIDELDAPGELAVYRTLPNPFKEAALGRVANHA